MVMIANIFSEQLQLPCMDELPFQKSRSAGPTALQLPKLTQAFSTINEEVQEDIEITIDTPRASIEGAFSKLEAVCVEIEEEKFDSEDQEDELLIKKCNKVHECGHECNGVAGETECLPCLQQGCNKDPL